MFNSSPNELNMHSSNDLINILQWMIMFRNFKIYLSEKFFYQMRYWTRAKHGFVTSLTKKQKKELNRVSYNTCSKGAPFTLHRW